MAGRGRALAWLGRAGSGWAGFGMGRLHMRFSASRLKAHMACSLRAKYRYEDKLPSRQNAKASFGTVIHQAIAHFYESRGDHSGAVHMFRDLWAHPEKAGVEPDYWPKNTSFGSLMVKGVEMLDALNEKVKWNDITLIGTEIPFLVPFGEHELTGFVDLLTIEKSGTGKELLLITDHKTAGKAPSIAELALDIQFTTYAFASRQKEFWVGADDPAFPGLPNGEWLWSTVGSMMERRCIWNHLMNGRQIDAGPRVTADYERMYRLCNEIEYALKLGVAVPTIGDSCNFCDFKEACQLEIPVSIGRLEDKDDDTRWV